MKLLLTEQDLVDSCCVFASDVLGLPRQSFVAKVQFLESDGIIADVHSQMGRGAESLHLSEQDVIDGVALMLQQTRNLNPNDLLIDLFYEDGLGLGARVDVTGQSC